MPADDGTYAIGDLAGLAGTTPRTVRYYVAQGLLPAPAGVGPGAHYTDGHLARLRLIRRLQRQHQPLSAIRERLASLDEDDVAALLSEADQPLPEPGDSALEYVRSILGATSPRVAEPAPAMPVMPVAPVARQALPAFAPSASAVAPSTAGGAARRLRSFALPRVKDVASDPVVPADAEPRAPERGPEAEARSQWDRIAITPNIEIHVRRPLSRLENRRVERLITIARQVLREEQP